MNMYAEENMDLFKVSQLLRAKRKNASHEIVVSPYLVGPKMKFHNFIGTLLYLINETETKEALKPFSTKTVFYYERNIIKYSSILYLKVNDDIHIISGSVYESGICPAEYHILLKNDSDIPILCTDLPMIVPPEVISSIVYKILYPYYRDGGKSFYNKFKDSMIEEMFGLESEDCIIMKPLKVTANSSIFNYESEEKTPLKEENLDLFKVSALLRYKRKNRSNEIIVEPSITGPRLSFYYFAKFAFDQYDRIEDLLKTNYAKTVFYGENGNIKYSSVIYSKENGDIKIVSGSVYEESGDCPIDYILLLKEDGNIPVVCKDLTENNPKEEVGSIVFKVLYHYYKNGGKSFYNKFREYTEEIFGLESKECAIMKPLKVSLNSLLFEDKEKYPIKEENLLVGPEEAVKEDTKEENSPAESVEEDEENLLLIAPKETNKEEENASKESAKEEEEENLLVGPNEAAVKEEENLSAEPEETVNESGKTFNAAKQFSKPYNAGGDSTKSNKKLEKKLLKHVMPPDNFTIEFDCGNKKKAVVGIVIDHITIWRKNNKIDFKKSFVSFTEYRCKDTPVKKDKNFAAFKKYLENKKMKRTWFLPGLFNCKVSVA